MLVEYSLTQIYSLQRPLLIQVADLSKQKVVIPVQTKITQVAYGGYSLPIIFDLKNQKPADGLTITAEIQKVPYSGLTIHGKSKITIDFKNWRGEFILKAPQASS